MLPPVGVSQAHHLSRQPDAEARAAQQMRASLARLLARWVGVERIETAGYAATDALAVLQTALEEQAP